MLRPEGLQRLSTERLQTMHKNLRRKRNEIYFGTVAPTLELKSWAIDVYSGNVATIAQVLAERDSLPAES